MDHIRIALAQLNLVVGNVAGNGQKIIEAVRKAIAQKANIILFSELALTAYPLEDLLYRSPLYEQTQHALNQLLPYSKQIDIVIGLPIRKHEKHYNAALWLQAGKIIAEFHKQKLPNYSVFDECRYFVPGDLHSIPVVEFHGLKFAVLICEDLWYPDVMEIAKARGAQFIFCLNASPYSTEKSNIRRELLKQRVTETGLPIFYVNQVGGQDELVFDGDSQVIDADGEICAHGGYFQESLTCVDLNAAGEIIKQALPHQLALTESVYRALVLGVRDYVHKNNFPGALIGLSGGIDSALTLAIAVDAIGADKVTAVLMPSQYTLPISIEDAKKEADSLGVRSHIIPIQRIFESFLRELNPFFNGLKPDITEENIQARARGTLLMALSNKTGRIVLTTGNKSEMAVGYATLYGDMAGGFAVIKDVYKMMVYQLAHYCNRKQEIIPERVMTRAPSAELALNQKDEDSLPPYSVLDAILERYIDKNQEARTIIQSGFDEKIVFDVIKLVQKSEYKRRQAPIGIRITEKAFGRDRRYPITSGYRETAFNAISGLD